MKKIFTLIAMVCLTVASAMAANTKECDLSKLPSTSENTTWDAATKTFAWSATYYNSMELFAGGDYSPYSVMNVDIEAGTMSEYRIIVKYSNGTQSIAVLETGIKSLSWSDLSVDEANLKIISSIRISGAQGGTGDVKINSVVLEGSDEDKVYYDVPFGSTHIKNLTGPKAPANWASTCVFPKTFAPNGNVVGDGDGSNEGTYVDVSGYEKIRFVVTSDGGNDGIRVWMWNGSGVTTLYAHPEDEEDANYEDKYLINKAGRYVIKFNGLTCLKGIKSGNNWGNPGNEVGVIYVTPAGVADGFPFMDGVKYTIKGDVKKTVNMVTPAEFNVFETEGFTAMATLAGSDETGFIMDSEDGVKGVVLNNMTVKEAKIVYTAASSFVLNGKTFQLRNAAGDAQGTIFVGDDGVAEDATIYYAGMKIGEISNIQVRRAKSTDVPTGIVETDSENQPEVIKVTDGTNVYIIKGGVKYNVAGMQM